MARLRKGTRLVCVPCGREVTLDACGLSTQTIWCCGKPMSAGKKASRKKAKRPARKRR